MTKTQKAIKAATLAIDALIIKCGGPGGTMGPCPQNKPKTKPSRKDRSNSTGGLRAQQVKDVKHAVQYAKDLLSFKMRDDGLLATAIKRQKQSGKAVRNDMGYAIGHAKGILSLKPSRGLASSVAKKFRQGGRAQKGESVVDAISQSAVGSLFKAAGLPFKAARGAFRTAKVIWKERKQSGKNMSSAMQLLGGGSHKSTGLWLKSVEESDLKEIGALVSARAGADPTPKLLQAASMDVVRAVLEVIEELKKPDSD